MTRQRGATPAARITAEERRARALTLRKTGASYQAIADAMTVSKATAARLVKRALDELRNRTAEAAQELVDLECLRYDAMLMALWPKIQQGKEAAVQAALQISRERRKLLGLDKPDKLAPTDPTGEQPYDALTDAQRAERIAELLERARTRRDGGTP